MLRLHVDSPKLDKSDVEKPAQWYDEEIRQFYDSFYSVIVANRHSIRCVVFAAALQGWFECAECSAGCTWIKAENTEAGGASARERRAVQVCCEYREMNYYTNRGGFRISWRTGAVLGFLDGVAESKMLKGRGVSSHAPFQKILDYFQGKWWILCILIRFYALLMTVTGAAAWPPPSP